MRPAEYEIFIKHFAETLANDALTDPMSLKELTKYFDRNRRTVKAMLDNTEGVERHGALYRVPYKKMSLSFLKEQGLIMTYDKIVQNRSEN